MGKPRFTEVSEEVATMFLKAQELIDRLDSVQKAQPEYSVSYNTKPQETMLVSESGGQTRNAHYQTNNHLLDSDDVANKGAISTNFSLESLRSKLNPHENPLEGHLNTSGD